MDKNNLFFFKRCTTEEDLIPIHEIREEVLFAGRSYDRSHGDDRKPNHHNFLCLWEGKPVGVVRIDFYDEMAAVRLVGVLPAYQGKGIGSQMLKYVEDYARSYTVKKLVVNVRKGTEEFYKKNGYSLEVWIDPGVGTSEPTVGMAKNIQDFLLKE